MPLVSPMVVVEAMLYWLKRQLIFLLRSLDDRCRLYSRIYRLSCRVVLVKVSL
mgnify:CR=1|jgi:hypothetical protein